MPYWAAAAVFQTHSVTLTPSTRNGVARSRDWSRAAIAKAIDPFNGESWGGPATDGSEEIRGMVRDSPTYRAHCDRIQLGLLRLRAAGLMVEVAWDIQRTARPESAE